MRHRISSAALLYVPDCFLRFQTVHHQIQVHEVSVQLPNETYGTSMAAWVPPVSILRVPARMELWSWATRPTPLSFTRNSAMSTPYADTTPMVALREYPVPKTQLDSSIFEVSEEDEYRSVAESFKRSITATTPVATNSSGFSSSSLLQLIHQEDYVGASRVRTEMILHQMPITPDHAFISPAIHAVSSPTDPATRLREFSAWLSLLPVVDERTKSRPVFGRLTHLLSNSSRPDVDLIMAFARICVSKGYTIGIPDQMIPLVVRFAPPSTSLQFLEDLCSLVVEKSTLNKQMKRKIRFWCKTAMKEYLGVGLVEEATKSLQMGLQYGPSLPRVPSRWLGKVVADHPDSFGLPEETIAALNPPKTPLPYYARPARRPGLVSEIPSALSPLGFDTDPSDPKALLSRVWESTRVVKPPDPLDVARFLEMFDSKPATIRVLSAYNQSKPTRYREGWILGEMLYYARRKEWRQLVGAFDKYFFRAGVPGNIDEHKWLGRVTAHNVHQRLFPSAYHTSLVWMAVVEILRGDRPVSILFKEMIEQATAAKTGRHTQVGSSLVSTSTRMFDAAHFTPFLVAAYRERRYKRLVDRFLEMSRLGIEPEVEQLSLLAGAHAGRSEGHAAVRLLDRIEGALREGAINRTSRPHHRGPRIVTLYLPALEGFIVRKDVPGALLVKRRILGHGYVKGTSAYVDRMLAELEAPTV